MTSPKEITVRFRCSEADVELFDRAADLDEETFSNWARRLLRKAARAEIQKAELRAELDDSQRDREALAEARGLIVNHVIATGGCASVDGMGQCDRPLCSYCALARLRLDDKEPADD